MIQQAERVMSRDARIPIWRRVTALFTLSSIVVIAGVTLAVAIGTTAMLMLFVLERAIAG